MPKWFSNAMPGSTLKYALCVTQDEFNAIADELGAINDDFLPSDCDAMTHIYQVPGKGPRAVVCIRLHSKHSMERRYTTLVHEAVHVWQTLRDYICEEKPSEEFEAYTIETIASTLILAYKRRRK